MTKIEWPIKTMPSTNKAVKVEFGMAFIPTALQQGNHTGPMSQILVPDQYRLGSDVGYQSVVL